ncbi:MAG TPA: hypothetical protein VF559_11710 [Caulobacteraceae bacterium]
MKAEWAQVHIGFEKTGSTTIQRFLGVNHARLKQSGVLYPLAAGRPSQANLPAAVMEDGRVERMRARLGLTSDEALATFRDRFRADLTVEVEAARPRTLLFSHENLSTRLRPPEIARLHDFLGDFAERVTILAYVRRQDELPMSLYSTAVLGGRAEPFAWPEPDAAPGWFDYHPILCAWRDAFGAENLQVRRYGRRYFTDKDLLADLAQALGLPSGLEPAPRLNSGFDLQRLEFVRLLNGVTGGQADPRWHALARRLHDTSEGPGLGASRRRRKAFAAAFEESNRKVARDFLGLDGPLFDHPFPNNPPPRGPWLTPEAAVGLAAELLEPQAAEGAKKPD